jgi:sentrin-specific protease 1
MADNEAIATDIAQDMPKQSNGTDCGIFMVKAMHFRAKGAQLLFKQEHCCYFRHLIAKELIMGKLIS